MLCAALAGACGGSTGRAPAPRNVVLICLDTVRADHLGTYGYERATTPALDELARGALTFAHTSSTAGWTKPSVPSFLTGTYPLQHGVYEGSAHDEAGEVTDLLPDEAFTLAEAFQENGYRTAAFVHNAQLRAGNGFEQGFELYREDGMDAREIRWHGLDWLDRRKQADPEEKQPFFLYLHFLDAHWPYPAPEEWITRFEPGSETERFRGKDSKALYASINSGEHPLSAGDRDALEALYDGALAYLDSELGHLFAGLAQRGLDENTVVCVVADHGEEFGEHGKVGHGHGLWENLLHVPWILRIPGRAPERNEAQVSLIDLFPTLLAAAGLPPVSGLAGVDRLADPRAERPIFAEHKAPDRYFQTLRIGDQKLQRVFTPPVTPALDEPGELGPPISIGTRWEAEFTLVEGALVATRLKLRDEATDDPPELKGPIEDLGETEFRIGGVRVRYDANSKRQTEPGTNGPALANGQVVKVRGPHAGDALQAERIKFYAAGEATQLELRATVERLRQEGAEALLSMGGFEVRTSAHTEFKGVDRSSSKRKLGREQIAQLVDAGAGPFAAANGYEIQRTLHDLARDPGELAGQPADAEIPLDRRLDELGIALAPHRIFGAGDQKALDAQAMQELQDIGYGGGGH